MPRNESLPARTMPLAADAPLTIVHVSTERGWRGGEQQVRLLADGLSRRGHKSIVVCPANSALAANLREHPILNVEHKSLRYVGEFDMFAAWRLARVANAAGAHIVHAHTSHAHSLASLARHRLRARIVVSRRVDFPVGKNRWSRKKYFEPEITWIAISCAVKDVLTGCGIPESRIAVVHSGVDPDRLKKRNGPRDESLAARWGAKSGQPLLLNVAALTDHKDQATLLHAAARLREAIPDFRLVIAGSGELEKPLKELATELDLDSHVVFAGYVSDLDSVYGAADVFVLSSHLEGLCTSILDALSVGVPVVATRTGGIPEIIEHGRNGLLAPPRGPNALAAEIQRLLEDPAMQAAFIAEGRKTVQREFTADAMVEGTLKVYRKILNTT